MRWQRSLSAADSGSSGSQWYVRQALVERQQHACRKHQAPPTAAQRALQVRCNASWCMPHRRRLGNFMATIDLASAVAQHGGLVAKSACSNGSQAAPCNTCRGCCCCIHSTFPTHHHPGPKRADALALLQALALLHSPLLLHAGNWWPLGLLCLHLLLSLFPQHSTPRTCNHSSA
jgi:hypothetical protein